MNEVILLDSLANHLTEHLKTHELKTKGGDCRSPCVFCQLLPLPKTPKVVPRNAEVAENPPDTYGPEDFEENFPCVVVRYADSTSESNKGSTVNMRILVGIYDDAPDAQGYRDVLNVMDDIELFLAENETLDRRFRKEGQIEKALFTDQPWPVFFGEMRVRYTCSGPVKIIKRKEGDWRDGTYPTKPEP